MHYQVKREIQCMTLLDSSLDPSSSSFAESCDKLPIWFWSGRQLAQGFEKSEEVLRFHDAGEIVDIRTVNREGVRVLGWHRFVLLFGQVIVIHDLLPEQDRSD
jgi:hypothetical protein